MTYQSEVLADSPLAYWRLDEAAGVTSAADAAGGASWPFGTGVTTGGTPLLSDGGGSVHGDGSHIIAASPSLPTGTSGGTVSVEAWVRIPSALVQGPIIKVGDTQSNGWGVGVGGTTLDNTGHQLILVNETIAWVPTGYILAAGIHHIVVTRSSGNAFTVYVDGSSVYTTSFTPNAATGGITVGGYATRFLSASVDVDNVAVFTSVLSSARVTAHYNAGSGSNTALSADSPLVWLKLDDAASTVFADATGNGRSATVVGSVTLGGSPAKTAIGGTSVTLASGQYGSIADPAWINTLGALSVEAWFKTTSATRQAIVSMDNIDVSPGFASRKFDLFLDSTGQVTWMSYTSSGGFPYAATTTAYNDGAWHHVVGTRTTTGMTIYVDGASVATQTISGTLSGSSVDLRIGAAIGSSVAYPFVGSLDEVAVYSGALSSTRVTAHYNAASSTSPSGPVAATLPALTASITGTAITPGTVSATLPALTASASGTVAGVTTGAVAATLPTLTASVTGDVPTPVSGTVAATLPALTAAIRDDVGQILSSGFGWGDALTSGTITLAPQTLSSGFGWGSALTTNTVTLQVMESGFGWGSRIEQPRDWGIPAGSTRPASSVAIAHRDGTTVTVLDDVTIGALTKAVNVIDSWSFAVDRDNARGKKVDPIALEAHLYRGDVLMSKGPIGPGRESNGTITYDVSDPRRYLWDSESGRRIDRRPKLNWAYNGDFTLGTAGWTGGYEDGSIPAANPVFYVVDEPESSSGKGLRIEGVDKVVTAVSSVSSAAVFVPNSDTYLSGGAAKVIAAAAGIPNGANISIVGHTADDGTGDGLHLSWLRALRAKGTLAGYNATWTFSVLPGLRSPNETGSGVAGRGYYEPVATNSTEAGRTKNRRVDLHYATTQTAAGHMQYVVQRKYNVVNPVASKVPLEVTVAGRMRIGEWLGAPANGWAMRVSLLDSGFHIVGEVGTVTMDEATPRERFHDYSATIEVPADGQVYSLWYKLYPPAGWAVWSDIVVYPDEQLGFFDTDQALIVRDLVQFAQDASYGHGDLGIGTRTPLTGVTRIREYPFHEHKPVGTAIEEFTSLAYALDVDCETTPTTSTIVTHYPRQGSASGLTFAHGGPRSIVKAYRRLPSSTLASSVAAVAWGIQTVSLERFVSDPVALGGTLLETVVEADGESPLRELTDVAQKALARGIHPLAAWEVDLDPARTTEVLDRLRKGDTALLSLPDEGVHSLHRCVSMIWDPATDGLTLQMAPEEG